MKSVFTHWANLEAARDDSSMNLKVREVGDRYGRMMGSSGCDEGNV